MKKILTIFLLLTSISLLETGCKKSDKQSSEPYQVTINTPLNHDNVTVAMNAASKELNWPYIKDAPVTTNLMGTYWILKPKVDDPFEDNLPVLSVHKNPRWEESKQETCGPNRTGYGTDFPVDLTSPTGGQACFVKYVRYKQEMVGIKIFIKDDWAISADAKGNSFTQAKEVLDHFINNLE